VSPGGVLTQEGAGDVLGDLVPRAAGLREVRQLPVQHPFELRAAGRAQRGGGQAGPPAARPGGALRCRGVHARPAAGTLTLLEAISLTECLVCSVSSWSRHQSSSSRVSRDSFWWASSAGGSRWLGKGPAGGTATRHGGTRRVPAPRAPASGCAKPSPRACSHPPLNGAAGGTGGRRGPARAGGWGRASPSSGAQPRHTVPIAWRARHTACHAIPPGGDSRPRGQPGSRGAPLAAGVLLMEGLTSTGAFPPPPRREGRLGGRSCRKPDMDPKGQSRSSALAGGALLHPQGPAGPVPGAIGTPSSPQKHPPRHPLPALTGEAGLAPGGQAAARCSPTEHGGLSGRDPQGGVPPPCRGSEPPTQGRPSPSPSRGRLT